MIRRIIFFIVAILALFVLSYPLHQYIIKSKEIILCYALFSIYLFHVITAILVYVIVEFVANHLPNQAGYGYLTSVFLKLGFFVMLFNNPIFTSETLSKPERFSLVIPLFLFLTIEALAVAKLLNTK